MNIEVKVYVCFKIYLCACMYLDIFSGSASWEGLGATNPQ